VIVGSADFTESQLIGSIYSQALQAAGVKTKEQFNIGSREVYIQALKDGSIDLVPEYTGALLSYLDPKSTAADTAAVSGELSKKLPEGISMLTPSPAEDKDVVAVTQATADKYQLKTISDLKPHRGRTGSRRAAGMEDENTGRGWAPRRLRTQLQGLRQPGRGRNADHDGSDQRPDSSRRSVQHRSGSARQPSRRSRG
jgi:glycine betaine/choline ABC-type transport system substrate-binding protein